MYTSNWRAGLTCPERGGGEEEIAYRETGGEREMVWDICIIPKVGEAQPDMFIRQRASTKTAWWGLVRFGNRYVKYLTTVYSKPKSLSLLVNVLSNSLNLPSPSVTSFKQENPQNIQGETIFFLSAWIFSRFFCRAGSGENLKRFFNDTLAGQVWQLLRAAE